MFERLDAFSLVDLSRADGRGLGYLVSTNRRGRAGPFLCIGDDGERYIVDLTQGDYQYRVKRAAGMECLMMLYSQPIIEVDPSTSYGAYVSPEAGDLRVRDGLASIAAYDYVRRDYRPNPDAEPFTLWQTEVENTGERWYKRWRLIDATRGNFEEPRVLWSFGPEPGQPLG